MHRGNIFIEDTYSLFIKETNLWMTQIHRGHLFIIEETFSLFIEDTYP